MIYEKTATDRTSPGRIYRRFSGWKFSQIQGAWEGSCGILIEKARYENEFSRTGADIDKG